MLDLDLIYETNNGCWELFKLDGQKNIRLDAWRQFRGNIPSGKQILTKCNNKYCGNPLHLVLINTEVLNRLKKSNRNHAKNQRQSFYSINKKMKQTLLAISPICNFCSSSENLVLDHIIPINIQAKLLSVNVSDEYRVTSLENLQLLCLSCKKLKDNFHQSLSHHN